MPPKKLENRVALITGAGRGIGRAIALGFAREGAWIAAAGRTGSDLNSLVEEVSGLGSKAIAIPADLSDPAVPAKVAREAENALGSLDILVNNAGIGSSLDPKPIVDFDDEFWNLSLALNLTAPYLLCKAVLPTLSEEEARTYHQYSLACFQNTNVAWRRIRRLETWAFGADPDSGPGARQ